MICNNTLMFQGSEGGESQVNPICLQPNIRIIHFAFVRLLRIIYYFFILETRELRSLNHRVGQFYFFLREYLEVIVVAIFWIQPANLFREIIAVLLPVNLECSAIVASRREFYSFPGINSHLI